jgi:DNA repair protein RadC
MEASAFQALRLRGPRSYRYVISPSSPADIQLRKTIAEIARPLGIAVHDHIIVGKNGHASLKGLKLI